MRRARVFAGVCAVLVCVGAATPQVMNTAQVSPLILEKDEGERRVVRGWPGHPEPGETVIFKVDPKNGGSSHLVLMTVDLAPGGEIITHKHPGSDEILYLETGTARVHVGDSERVVRGGATVFIPAGTWIAVANIGKNHVSGMAVFSAPGFEDYMRAVTVREGEKNVPMTPAEDEAVEKMHAHDVVYQ